MAYIGGDTMRVDSSRLLPTIVTIVNRVKGKDNDTGKDVFYKTVLKDCVYGVTKNSKRQDKVITYSDAYFVQIPDKQNKPYLIYQQFIKSPTDNFTVSVDDYIFKGEIEEEITPQNISSILKQHSTDSFKIELFSDLTTPEGSLSYGDNFLMRYASIYYVEGV